MRHSSEWSRERAAPTPKALVYWAETHLGKSPPASVAQCDGETEPQHEIRALGYCLALPLTVSKTVG